MNLVNLPIAFGAGLISITSPCCLPLLPGYLGYLTGLSSTEVGASRRRPLLAALLFVAGFTAVFAALGATASVVGQVLLLHRPVFERVAGGLVLAMGLVVLLEGRIALFARSGDWTQRWGRGQLWAALPLGAAFAITWTPCIGPVLGGVLTLAGTTDRIGEGVLLLVVYSLGLGVPFLALSLSVERVRGWLQRVAGRMAVLRVVSGGVLTVMGGLLLSGQWLQVMAPLLRLYSRAQWPPA